MGSNVLDPNWQRKDNFKTKTWKSQGQEGKSVSHWETKWKVEAALKSLPDTNVLDFNLTSSSTDQVRQDNENIILNKLWFQDFKLYFWSETDKSKYKYLVKLT